MDKDVLRLGIIAVGVLTVMVILLWSIVKKSRHRGRSGGSGRDNALDHIDESLFLHPEHDDFDIVPLGSARDQDQDLDPISVAAANAPDEEPQEQEQKWPDLVTFSVEAKSEEGFVTADIFDACERAELEYGSVRVFERVNQRRQVDYAVANMAQPGTFPDNRLEPSYCPGLMVYLQPNQVSNPADVFEDLLETIDFLAAELDGEKKDPQREPLTEEKIEYFRRLFA